MDKSLSKLSSARLERMFGRPVYQRDDYYYCNDSEDIKKFFKDVCLGKFSNILDVLFNSTDGSLDNDIQKYVSESAPSEVRSFVNNVLLTPLSSLTSAKDDDMAFEALIPRCYQTRASIAPYISQLKEQFNTAFERFKASQTKSD